MEDNERHPREILEQLTEFHAPLRWAPLTPTGPLHEWAQHPLRDDASLAYLHAHWSMPEANQMEAGRGMMARLRRRFARRAQRALAPRLQAELDLLSHLVQMTDALATRVDELTRHQVEETANQARLAGWLDATLPAPGQ